MLHVYRSHFSGYQFRFQSKWVKWHGIVVILGRTGGASNNKITIGAKLLQIKIVSIFVM